MNKRKNDSWDLDRRLRARAEAKLASIKLPHTLQIPKPANEILHELQVHQIELEMQNEELRRVQHELEESRARYIDLYEFAPVCYLTLTAQGTIAEINLTGATLLGMERKKLVNCRFDNLIVPEDRERWHSYFLEIRQQNNKQSIDLTVSRADGSTFHAHLDCLVIVTENDAQPMLRATLTDISKAREMEQQLRIAATIFESPEGMVITDTKGEILQVNRAFCNITGYRAEEVIGKNPSLLQSGRHDEDFYRTMWDSIHHTGSWKGEVWDRRKNGEIYPARLIITAVKDQNGVISHYVSTFDDITLGKLAADEIERLAFYDPLTDLPNRRQLLTRLHQALASSLRHDREGAILFVDLDNFKNLNDTLGHHIGDLLLKQVAKRLIAAVREEDTVARLGGDEFIVMLEDLSQDIETAAAEVRSVGVKILAALNQPYSLEDNKHISSASIGIVLFNGRRDSVGELLKQADIAMYQAKSAGRNTLRFFDPEMQSTVTVRTTLEDELYRAVSEQEFECYFQPQVDHSDTIIGAEILIRWQHPERGMVLPMDFIPRAEEIGLILPIGLWVLETACTQLKKWQASPLTEYLQLAVNISAYQLHHFDFVEQAIAIIKKAGINPSKLKFELAENLVLNDINNTVHKMIELKKFGVGFSLDNFGKGYFSLSCLAQMSFKQIKIDQSFVHKLCEKSTAATITQTIIGITRSLGIEVIAEGVETEAQRAFLQQHGCPTYQGYLFSQAVSLDAFEQLLHRQHSPM